MKPLLPALAAALAVAGCSTTGGIYNSNDPKNSDFSLGNTVLSVLGAVAAVAVTREVARSGGGAGSYANSLYDYDWAWDQFYNQTGQLVWACRGIQTGQFADLERCRYKPVHDNTWPRKY